MAQAVEKLFLTKVAQMPSDEVELAIPVKGGKKKKGRPPGRPVAVTSSSSAAPPVQMQVPNSVSSTTTTQVLRPPAGKPAVAQVPVQHQC